MRTARRALGVASLIAAVVGLAVAGSPVLRDVPSTTTAGANPLQNRAGTLPGLGAVPKSELDEARALIRRVRVGKSSSTPYDRRAFGSAWTDDTATVWGHNGCSTRDDVLRRDLTRVRYRESCVVASGRLSDPYTGATIEFSKARAQAVQVDHVVALHYAWQHGADRWSATRRETYANDPLVLLAVDGPTNIKKSDHGPAEWHPPNDDAWCALSVRQAQAEIKYSLTVTAMDRRAMLSTCS